QLDRRDAQLRRSAVLDLGLLLLSFALGQLLFWGVLRSSGPFARGGTYTPSRGPAMAWYAWIALPLFLFVTTRALWRWLLWAAELLRIARFPLRLAASHPDRAAGLDVLARPTVGFVLFVAGCCAVLAGAWGTEILRGHAVVQDFLDRFSVLVCFFVVLGF